MKWIGRKWKQLSGSKRIWYRLFIGTVFILAITVGLRIWEQSKQKPRVLAALKQLAEEASEQGDFLAPLLEVIQEGRVEQEGYVNFSSLNVEGLGADFKWLKQMDMTASSIWYRLDFQRKEELYFREATYQIAGIGALNMESYLDDKQLIVRIPQIHSNFLRMNVHDIKGQYENSLLYGVLGEKLVIPEEISVFADPVFPWERELVKVDVVSAFLEEYKGRLTELWRQISVKKESETKQVFANGFYKNCSVFRLSLPMELVQWYLDYALPDFIKEQLQAMQWREEYVELFLYLDDDNKIRRIETVVEPRAEGTVYFTKVFCDLKGEEWLLNKVQIEFQIEQQTEQQVRQQTEQQVRQQTEQQVRQQTEQQVRQQTEQQVRQQTEQQIRQQAEQQVETLDLWIDMEKRVEGTERRIYFSVRQTSPKEMERIRANLVMDMDSGETDIEYEINLPLLVADGEHSIRRLEQMIEVPDGEIVDIFELDLIGFLKFSRDFNFDLFR